jgi:hypothetical protein
MVRFGILLIVLAVLSMIIPLLLPGLMQPLGIVYCEPGERLTGELSDDPYIEETTGALVYNCVNSDHQTRLVTASVVLSSIVTFVVLLIVGVLVTIWGVSRLDFSPKESAKSS